MTERSYETIKSLVEKDSNLAYPYDYYKLALGKEEYLPRLRAEVKGFADIFDNSPNIVEVQKALAKLQQPDLLNKVKEELGKDHLLDDKLKLTLFLVALSGLSAIPKGRMSMALKGDSATGKDNLIKTILKNMPLEPQIFLTSGTQATVEDDIKEKRIIAFSEVNQHRESGANKHLTEVIKQKTEGGTSALKKDHRTGFKTSRHEVGEQGTVLYGTTEADKDQELGTRFIEGDVPADPKKTDLVNDNTCDYFCDVEKLVSEQQQKDTWLRIAITHLFRKNPDRMVFVPYSKLLKGKVNGKKIIDNKDPRAQRDTKRLWWLVCAMTWLHQEQRDIMKDARNKEFIISEPQDFFNVLEIAGEFFSRTYSGIEGRLQDILNIIDNDSRDWIPRDEIERKLDKAKNTIKTYCKILSEKGLIEGTTGKSELERIPFTDTIARSAWEYNKSYYRRCQKGVKKQLIRCQVSELKEYFENELNTKFDTLNGFYTGEGVKKQGVKKGQTGDTPQKCPSGGKIDTLKLTPSSSREEIQSAGYTEQEAEETLK